MTGWNVEGWRWSVETRPILNRPFFFGWWMTIELEEPFPVEEPLLRWAKDADR